MTFSTASFGFSAYSSIPSIGRIVSSVYSKVEELRSLTARSGKEIDVFQNAIKALLETLENPKSELWLLPLPHETKAIDPHQEDLETGPNAFSQ
jgi:hypothetical protein